MLKEAQKLEPDHPLILYHLGLAYEAQGNKELASENLRKALNLGLLDGYPNEAKGLLKLLIDNNLVESNVFGRVYSMQTKKLS